MYELKKMERYLRVNLLGPGPRLMKKEFTWPRSRQRLRNTALEALWPFKPPRPQVLQQYASPWRSPEFLKPAGLSLQGCGDTNTGWTYLQECEICNLLSCCSRLNGEGMKQAQKYVCFLITLEPTVNKLFNISVMQHLQIP